MEKTFIKARSVSDWVSSFVLVISGVVLIVLRGTDAITGIGIFLCVLGLVFFFTLKTGYRDARTRKFYNKREHYFAHSRRSNILDALQSGHPDNIDYNEEDQGTGLRLDVYYNKKDPQVYMYLFEYKPYRYIPCTDVFVFDSKESRVSPEPHPIPS